MKDSGKEHRLKLYGAFRDYCEAWPLGAALPDPCFQIDNRR